MSRVSKIGIHFALVISVLGWVACGSSTDERPTDWPYISAVILQPNCATVSCHSRAAALSGLDFSDPERGYTSLTRLRFQIVDPHADGEGCQASGSAMLCKRGARPLITPFDPGGSRLVRLLRERASPRMPPDRPLFEADIRLIEAWILLGASKEGLPFVGVPDAAASSAGGAGR